MASMKQEEQSFNSSAGRTQTLECHSSLSLSYVVKVNEMIATKVPALLLLLLCIIKYSTYTAKSYTLALSGDFWLPIPQIFPLVIGFPGNAYHPSTHSQDC
jgi:hypothetical protein